MELLVIQNKIYDIRGSKVMLDYDLAALYEVETRALNQAVKRNIRRFPIDFKFNLNKNEWETLMSQFMISKSEKRPISNSNFKMQLSAALPAMTAVRQAASMVLTNEVSNKLQISKLSTLLH
ncbi:MAG: ORF6N domain-containing protein [Bacteroidota bacterium]